MRSERQLKSGRIVLLLAVFALITAACGGGEAATTTTTSGPVDTTESQPTPEAAWSYEVEFLAADGTPVSGTTWTPLPASDVSKPWKICSAIVHLKDSYWSALNYGLAEEAVRTGTEFTLFAAGGYTELATQINQLDDCVAQGAEGIIVGATSPDGVVAKVEEIVAKGIPVVGIGVPVFSPKVPVAFASFRLQGRKVGEFLLDDIGDTTDPVRVAWFPGPSGAGWPDDSLLGFQDVTDGTNIEIVDVKYGDTGKEVQLGLIEDTLQAYPEIDYIVGNAVLATVAPQALQEAGRDIPVISTYITPETYVGMKNGEILATVSDSTALTGRLGYDILIRILEGEDFLGTSPAKDVGPRPFLVTVSGLTDFEDNRDFHIAPDDFEPVFNYTP